MPNEPSGEAIEAARVAYAFSKAGTARDLWGEVLGASYAIDLAALQKQLENVTAERNNFWKFYTDTQQENERLKAKVQGSQAMADEKCRCFLERAQCEDSEFSLMGLPLCYPCSSCKGHVAADDCVCDECGKDQRDDV